MKTVISIIVLIVIVVFGFMFFFMRGPDISQFQYLKDPRIVNMPDQKMVEVKATGDPNVVGGKAFGLLFNAYYKIDGVSKGPRQPAPRARWPMSLETPKGEWVGLYAMPVPETTSELPEIQPEAGLELSLSTWEYGEVAEILHVGPYSAEEPTVNRLIEFIQQQGYEIVGNHEEEYVKGPGMFGKDNPEKYLTIIRYRVSKSTSR
jgi:hypothetical protein